MDDRVQQKSAALRGVDGRDNHHADRYAIAYHFTGPAPDSMCADRDGNLYVAVYSQGRVLVFNKNGIPIVQMLLPGRDEEHNFLLTSMALKPGTNDLYNREADQRIRFNGSKHGLWKVI